MAKSNYSLTSFAVLVLAVSMLSIYGLISAWTPPTEDPPGGNTPPPINVGDSNQTKAGSITASSFTAPNGMRSSEYCDLSGENCADLGGGSGIGASVIGQVSNQAGYYTPYSANISFGKTFSSPPAVIPIYAEQTGQGWCRGFYVGGDYNPKITNITTLGFRIELPGVDSGCMRYDTRSVTWLAVELSAGTNSSGYHWRTGSWGTCSYTPKTCFEGGGEGMGYYECGYGTQTRTVNCIDEATNRVTSDSNCSISVKPSLLNSCPATPTVSPYPRPPTEPGP